MTKPSPASVMPRVLVDPPWRRAAAAEKEGGATSVRIRVTAPPSSTSAAALESSPGEDAPRLEWMDGERERFKGPPTKALPEDSEERLYNRLLDELDRERLVPVTDLVKLGDDHLLELAGELRASHVDVRSLEHLLARLGDEFVAEAVAFVRVAAPERGLFEAMAPVRASILARTASSLFSQREAPTEKTDAALGRPFVKGAADTWLVRFADIAAPALAAIDATSGGNDKAARAALAWIAARGRVDAIPASHKAFTAPYAPLSELDDLWISFLAARGHEAQVLAMIEEVKAKPSAATLFVAHALSGNARAAATAWLEAHREEAKTILEAAADAKGPLKGSNDAAVAIAVLGGDATAGDPKLDEVPSAIPALPSFFDATKLPPPRLQDGTPLDVEAITVLGEMLRFTSLARPYPGIAQVRGSCDAASLDEFALAILNRWGEVAEPPSDLWALESAGKIGGDACAREVARRIRNWSKGAEPPRQAWDDDERRVVLLNEGDRGWAYARAGCQVLAANGTDLALTMLDDLARSGPTSWLRKEARRALDQASEVRNLRPGQQLADDIVPDLGLDRDGDGVTVLDLGSRTFKLTFDEMLTPLLVDADGTVSKTFPRSRKEDDADKSAAAKQRFQSLGKDTKVLARQQVAQLEGAMCSRRAWPADAFRQRFVQHPLLRHFARRLLWAYEDLSKLFRMAEDLTFAGEDDEVFTIDKNARIVLVHPILLAPEVRQKWVDRFADYQIVQPFAQLGRETFTIADEDHGQHQLARGQGLTAVRERFFQLSRRGWSARVENGWIEEYFHVLPAGAHARIGITPGMAMGAPAPETETEYTITTVSSTYALDKLPAIDFSELVRDVMYLTQT